MAYETELSNSAHPTDVISDGITAALVKKVVVLPLIRAEDLPVGTATKLFRKDGYLSGAANVNESASYSFAAGGELTQATVSATAVKTVTASKITVEAEQFGLIDQAKLIREQGGDLARSLDSDIKALFSGFTANTAVTATNILTVADIMEAMYRCTAAYAEPSGNYRGVFDFKGINEIRKELVASGASVFGIESMLTLLSNMPERPNGYAGSLPGIDLFQTDGLPLATSDDTGLVFNGDIAFGGMYAPSVQVRPTWVGTGGFYTELASWIFNKVVEWNDAGACRVLSDT